MNTIEEYIVKKLNSNDELINKQVKDIDKYSKIIDRYRKIFELIAAKSSVKVSTYQNKKYISIGDIWEDDFEFDALVKEMNLYVESEEEEEK